MSDVLRDLDPAARAAGEVRAREAGLSLAQWLEALIYERSTPTPLRRQAFFGDRLGNHWEKVSGSAPGATLISSSAHHDVETMAFAPTLRYPDIEGGNLRGVGAAHEGYEVTWSASLIVSAFPPRINHAAILLSAAFAEADVAFRPPPHRPGKRHNAPSSWYLMIIDNCLERAREVRDALAHKWTPSGRAERLWDDAFFTLCDLTPARRELLVLLRHDRVRASAELAKHLDLATQQFELSANLLAEVEDPAAGETSDEQRFRSLRGFLLEKAGGGLSLTQGAERLGVTRQALHKRIKAGTALGLMDGDKLVLPRLQFVDGGEKVKLVDGLGEIVRLFERSGGWSALQFFVEKDPNLAASPIEALRSGKIEAVVAAARAYLGLDDG